MSWSDTEKNQLRRENETLRRLCQQAMTSEAASLQARIEWLEAESAKLRAALEQVEWVYKSHVRDNSICPWCDGDPDSGHKPDCTRQTALRQSEGEK
jgi:hypothetical protein